MDKGLTTCFTSFDVLIPAAQYLAAWPVIACDQFTSQPEYWEELRRTVGEAPSALHCILPEAELSQCGEESYHSIRENMREYLQSSVFRECRDSFIYVERTLQDGSVRSGVVGVIDLEEYDYHSHARSAVRATEKTVEERIPPRMRIRRDAPLELSHVILMCDDARDRLFSWLRMAKPSLEKVYDLDLPMDGGHLTGYLVTGSSRNAFRERLALYCDDRVRACGGQDPLLFTVGDGNHSLGSAKACYEELKRRHADPDELAFARYAMAELENLRESARHIEPIHRLLRGVNPENVLRNLTERFGGKEICDGEEIRWIAGHREGTLSIPCRKGMIPTGILQDGLDAFTAEQGGTIDYIHGEDSLTALAQEEQSVGFLLPPVPAEQLFETIAAGGVLPRKTFSIGEAKEKRYYLEARRLRRV